MKRIISSCLLFVLLFGAVAIQAQPFAGEIAVFKKKDSISFPPKGAILFVGSSSFTKWTDVQDYFPGYTIINRGFGGSSLPDVIRYENDVIFPYDPKQIVIYCGENDLAASDTVTGQLVAERFKQLFRDIRNRYPRVPVAYISMKPSPSRTKLMPKMQEGNRIIKKFLKKKRKTAYINVYDSMLLPDGNPIPDIFISDRLHMNAKGYAIWQKIIAPYLVK